MRAVVVTTTVDDEGQAEAIARALVEERLAACVQVSTPIRSTYRWRGTIETAKEWLLQCKTSEARLPELMRRLRALHPYQVPEILAVPVTEGDPEYLAWIADSTAPSA